MGLRGRSGQALGAEGHVVTFDPDASSLQISSLISKITIALSPLLGSEAWTTSQCRVIAGQ